MTGRGMAGLHWVDVLPDRAAPRPAVDHEAIAAALRSRPRQWAEVPGINPHMSTGIQRGQRPAYRPAGAYEAQTRGGVLYLRYIGGGVR